MTMTDERLAELDAVMAKVRAFPFGSEEWEVAFIPARLAAYNAIPDLRAHIDAQDATIEKLLMAIRSAVDDFQLVVERIDDNQIDRAKGTAMAGERAATRTVLTATGAA
jgi:hypothetical protein